MSSLSSTDKLKIEQFFGMKSGYVLDFSDRTFQAFVQENVGKNIDEQKYYENGGSKANRLRSFWRLEPDQVVGKLLLAMFEYIETCNLLKKVAPDNDQKALLEACRKIAYRLTGKQSPTVETTITEDDFIRKEFSKISFDKIGLPGEVIDVLNQRVDEIKNCLQTKSWLSVVFLCGSALEGILLGIASGRSAEYMQATLSPRDKKTGAVFQIHDWKLTSLIDVSCELRVLDENVKKFSHALRDFRNYIHPYIQISSRFTPDEHTAKICWQVLQSVLEQASR